VGLVLVPLTDRSLRPLCFPPIIRNFISSAVCYPIYAIKIACA
jgi:hypothetical protein